MRLTPNDWQKIIRFVAAQDVRTPARLFESTQRWNKTVPKMLEETLEETVRELELAKSRGDAIKPVKAPQIVILACANNEHDKAR